MCLLLTGSLFTACVQKTYKRTIEFSVDYKGNADVKTAAVRGNSQPLNWDENFALADAEGDSVYTGSVVVNTPYDFIEVKFVKNEDVIEMKGKDNRKVILNKNGVTVVTATYNK